MYIYLLFAPAMRHVSPDKDQTTSVRPGESELLCPLTSSIALAVMAIPSQDCHLTVDPPPKVVALIDQKGMVVKQLVEGMAVSFATNQAGQTGQRCTMIACLLLQRLKPRRKLLMACVTCHP